MAPHRLISNRFGLKGIDPDMTSSAATTALCLILVMVLPSVEPASAKPVSYLGVEASENFSCKFYPMTLAVDDDSIGTVHSPRLSDDRLHAFESIFREYEIKYVLKDGYVYIPCEYYSDMNYLMNISRKAFSLSGH